MKIGLVPCLAIFSLASFGVQAASPDPTTLQVVENANTYELSVPVSRLVMSIPKENLTQKTDPPGGSNGPRYFCFKGEKQALIISGWLESADGFKGMEKFWKSETQSWRQKPKNVSFKKIGNWDVVIYDMEIPLPKTSNSHIRAELVQAGTWIDLHLSLTADQASKDARAELVKTLQRIRVVERK